MDAAMKSNRIYDNPFEGSSGPPKLTEIPGTNQAGRSVVVLSPSDDVPPSPAILVAVWGVESTEITISPAASHQIRQGQDTEPARLPLCRKLACPCRQVETSNSSRRHSLELPAWYWFILLVTFFVICIGLRPVALQLINGDSGK